MMELPEPPISVSEIGPIPPPPMFSSPSPLPHHRSVPALPNTRDRDQQRRQQREREQSLAAAIAMVVHNARNVDMYQLSHGT